MEVRDNSPGPLLRLSSKHEVYEYRKEEVATRLFGAVDRGHPYVKHMYEGSGDWLIGGEVELLGRVRYGDGLDKWRKTPKELFKEFEAKKADVVYAFQVKGRLFSFFFCPARKLKLFVLVFDFHPS